MAKATQKTKTGHEIPIPTRSDFEKTLDKVTTPDKLKSGPKKK